MKIKGKFLYSAVSSVVQFNHLNNITNSLGRIKPKCNYCTKTTLVDAYPSMSIAKWSFLTQEENKLSEGLKQHLEVKQTYDLY